MIRSYQPQTVQAHLRTAWTSVRGGHDKPEMKHDMATKDVLTFQRDSMWLFACVRAWS
jgi:hypothetical protein